MSHSPAPHVSAVLTTFWQVKNVTWCKKKSKQMKLLFEKSSGALCGIWCGRFINGSWVECGSPSLIKKTNNLALCCSNKSLWLERARRRGIVFAHTNGLSPSSHSHSAKTSTALETHIAASNSLRAAWVALLGRPRTPTLQPPIHLLRLAVLHAESDDYLSQYCQEKLQHCSLLNLIDNNVSRGQSCYFLWIRFCR